MPIGPVTIACLAGAVVFAFLRARAEQEARRHRTIEESDEGGARRPRLSRPRPRYTEEGEAHLERARRYRTFFIVLGLSALAAAWFGL